MNSQLDTFADQIKTLCHLHGVRTLWAFGSILRDDFDPKTSDADFLVEFEPAPSSLRLKNYLGLQQALSNLLSRPVDLVEQGAIRNPYVLRSIQEEQRMLYAA
jgi:predicted nucleotidyltransferase